MIQAVIVFFGNPTITTKGLVKVNLHIATVCKQTTKHCKIIRQYPFDSFIQDNNTFFVAGVKLSKSARWCSKCHYFLQDIHATSNEMFFYSALLSTVCSNNANVICFLYRVSSS